MPKYTVTDPQTGRKVTLTGDSPPTEQELEDIFASLPAPKQAATTADDVPVLSAGQQATPSQQGNTFTDVANEAALGFTRGGVGVVDALGSVIRAPVNAALRIADVGYQIPTLRESLSNTSQTLEGQHMESGLQQRIISSASELIPSSIAAGSAIRGAAASVPQIAQTANNMVPAIARQLGMTTAKGDAAYGALSGVGSELGRKVGGDSGALVGSVAEPLTPALAAQAGGAALRKIFGPSSAESAKNIIDDFASFGATPTVGMMSGKQSIQGAENVSAPAMGGSPLRKASEKIAQNMQAKLSNIADNISAKEGAETAGLAVQKGINGKGGFIDNFRQNNAVLWNKSDSLIDQTIPVDLANTKAKLSQLVQGGNMGSILDNPKLSQIKDALDNSATVDYETVRKLRSSIGQKLAGNDLVSDIPKAELKQIYGALSQDIKTLAQRSSPEALKAFERANSYTSAGHARIDDYLQRISNKVNPDQVFKDIAKGGEGVKAILTVKKSIPTEDWEVVASNVVRRLGRSSSGAQNAAGEDALGDAFSVNKFVTDWDKLGPARKAIFSGSEKLDRYSNDLNKIARAASVVKESRAPAANASGSAQAASRYAAGSAAVGSLVTGNATPILIAASGVAFNRAGARLMTNPKFVAMLAERGSKPVTKGFISSLVGLAKESSAQEAADIYEFAKELEDSSQ